MNPTALSGPLTSATRLYRLEWTDGAGPELAVEAWWGQEQLSGGYEYKLDLLTPDANLELKQFLGRAATLATRLADGNEHPRSGYVRAAQKLDTDGGLCRYRLTLVPWLWLLTRGRHNRVFQEKSVIAIVEAVFADYADIAAWHWADDIAPFLADLRPRSYCVQYNESDYAFVSRLLAEEGLGWRIETHPDTPGGHRAVFFADSRDLPEDPLSRSPLGGRGIRYHRADSQEQQDVILAFGKHLRLTPKRITQISHDYKAKQSHAASTPILAPGGESLGAALESYDDAGPYAFANRDEAERYGRLSSEAVEARAITWLGRGTVRSLTTGTRIDIVDLPQNPHAPQAPSVPPEPPGYLITELTHLGINNLTAIPQATIAARLNQSQQTNDTDELANGDPITPAAAATLPPELLKLAQERGYANAFTAQPAATPWRPWLDDDTGERMNPRPTAPGPMSAIVVGPNGQATPNGPDELWCDALGRIKVRFHWQQGDAPDDQDTCWIRVIQRQAGAGMGWQWLPRIGQEVLVDFLAGDIDRPYILGALYNGRGEGGVAVTPGGAPGETDTRVFDPSTDHRSGGQGNLAGGHAPAWHGGAADSHRHPGALTGFKTKEFGGLGFNQLVLDDSDGQQRVQLKSTQHASELNLGHLIHQADNYRGSFRGTGAELRTDAWGALRAGRGLIMSTWPHATPGSPAGDMAPAMALIRQAGTLANTLSKAAGTHQTVKLAAAIGTTGHNQSTLDDQAAPLKALHTIAGGMVDGKNEQQAQTDAGDKNTAAGENKVPHLTDPAIIQAARGDFVQVAGQSLQFANGETTILESGEESNFAIGGKTRIHAGQAIGLLAGAIRAQDGHGIRIIAGQDDIDLQAQSDEMKFQAKEEVKLVSVSEHIDFAAAKRVVLETEGGAQIVIENGNITVQCPGTITVHASEKRFEGPVKENYALPRFPDNPFENNPPHFNFKLTDMPGPDGTPLGDTSWRMVQASDANEALSQSESLLSGKSDAEGKLALAPEQEKQVADAYLSGKKVWVLFEGQIKQLEATQERDSWTDQQKLEHALDSLGFADSFGLAAESDSNEFAAPLVRDELGRPISTIYDKFKKGV